MHEPVESPYLVPFDDSFDVREAPNRPPPDVPSKKALRAELAETGEVLYELQRKLYAEDRRALLLVFQAMDAGGKDSTIRHVLSGINPAGFQVASFKQPSKEELDHDFLWRISRRLPERGRIGVFNRSHYEEVLVVRVHPQYLRAQRVPGIGDLDRLWAGRYRAIRGWERHVADSGTRILKFFLNVSKKEQKARLLSRIETPRKHWKFSLGDLDEREHWETYMDAYQAALRETSRPWAPWYAIPADDKPYMRATVAKLIRSALEDMGPVYPPLDEAQREDLKIGESRLDAES